MMKRLTYSSISYVVAALLLSGQVFANPADLSGVLDTNANVSGHGLKQEFYLALNRYPVVLPALSGTRSTNKPRYRARSEAYIDSLQRELRDQLDIIIDSQEIFTP